MPKVHVYVPVELQRQMKAVEKHRPNWSHAAQRAFARECKRLARYDEILERRPRVARSN